MYLKYVYDLNINNYLILYLFLLNYCVFIIKLIKFLLIDFVSFYSLNLEKEGIKLLLHQLYAAISVIISC